MCLINQYCKFLVLKVAEQIIIEDVVELKNITEARKNLAVEVTTYTDQNYRVALCFLHADGTWKSEVYYRETDFYGVGDLITHSETYWYRQDVIINENGSNGIKGFTLKYYKWVDDNGAEVDPDNLPGTVKEIINPVPIDPDTGEPMRESFLYAKTYTLRPTLTDDTIIDDALPRYADFDASLYVFEDVEYLTENTNIIYDGTVGSGDLPRNPPILPDEPKPFIRDSIVQPGAEKGKLFITWITNFTSDCTLTLDGVSYKVSGAVVVPGYYTYHAVVSASLNAAHTYSISGKGTSVTKSFRYNDSNRYLICGDPQIIDQSSADVWYKVQKILDPLPALIISMGDQVDAISDALTRTEQFHLFTKEHSVPIATVRGNHDKNTNYFGHFGLPDNADEANFYFKNNDVLFIGIDTNSADVEKHKNFIKGALEHNSYRWAILLMHHSLYSTSKRALTTHIKTLREGLTSFIVDETDICMRYSSSEQFAGFKPYSDKTPDYDGAPDIVWTEGTLGYAALALCVGEEDEAKKYVDECIALQNCEGCTGGVIYVTETYASLPWEFHVWESVVSSAWLYLIINNPDVLFPRTLRQVYYMVKTYNIKDERP